MLAPPGLDGVLSLEQQVALLSEEEQEEIFAALEADGVDLEELLYDWNWGARPQQFLDPEDESWSVALLLGGRGCITGDARVFLPLENRHERIDVLARDGKQIWVQTVNGPALTLGAPFLKGVAPTCRFSTEDGREVIVTGGHRFLTPQGWQRADSVREGQLLASASAVPPSGAGSTVWSLQDVRRSSRTDAGWLGSYSTCRGLGGRSLLPEAEACQSCSPSRDGGIGRGCASLSPPDVPAMGPADTRACQPSIHAGHARTHSALAWPSARAAGSRLLPADDGQSLLTIRGSARALDWSGSVSTLPGADLPTRRLVRLVHEGASSALPTSQIRIGWSRVRRISQAGTRPYYDMTVPGENHYLAEGLFHHNSGKSRAATEWVRKMDLEWPQNRQRWGSEGGLLRGALLSRTAADVRDTLLNGPSGLLHIYPPSQQDLIDWIPSRRLLILPGGSEWLSFSAEEPDQLRGPAFHAALADELAAHRGKPGVDGLIAWDNLRIACRMGRTPQIVASTTPKRVPVMRKLVSESADPAKKIIMRRMRTLDNPYLSASYLDVLTGLYAGTTIGAQELEGVMLDDVKGATTSDKIIDAYRIKDGKLPAGCMGPGWLRFVGVDPSVAEKPNDECGIVVVMVPMIQPLHARHAYVVDDVSLMASPAVWSDVVVQTALKYKATVIVESNQGGELVRMSVKHAAERANVPVPAVRKVWASTDKKTRAEPIGIAYERGRIHHINVLPELESQATEWVPGQSGYSPDRLDACLARGTVVPTSMGDKAIEDVAAGDYVWTRRGWKKVEAVRMTRQSAELLSVEMSDGNQLKGTPDHLILTGGGWARLDALVCGDTLSGWKESGTEELPTVAVPSALTSQHRVDLVSQTYTDRSTSTTSGRFLPAGTYITLMRTLTTTAHQILSLFRGPTTMLGTRLRGAKPSDQRSGLRTWKSSDHLQRNGTDQMKAGHGIESMGPGHGRAASLSTGSPVSIANQSSSHLSSPPSSALYPAATRHTTLPTPTGSASNVLSAAHGSGEASTRKLLEPADVSVVRSYANGVADVFDLQVEDEHEFVASGVIVHNCVWAISAGLYPESLKSGAPGQATSASPNRVQGVRRAPTRQINVARQASRR